MKQRNGNTPRTGSHIADEKTIVGLQRYRRFDEDFSFGPRDQNVGCDFEIQSKKLLMPNDVLERLSLGPSHNLSIERLSINSAQHLCGVSNNKSAIPAQQVCHQGAGIPSRISHTGTTKHLCGFQNRFSNCLTHRNVCNFKMQFYNTLTTLLLRRER